MLITLRYWYHQEQVWLLCLEQCESFSRTYDILFNGSKTKYKIFKRREIVNVAPLYFKGSHINYYSYINLRYTKTIHNVLIN